MEVSVLGMGITPSEDGAWPIRRRESPTTKPTPLAVFIAIRAEPTSRPRRAQTL